MTHERNFFVQVIFLDFSEDSFGQSIGIVHSVERNWRAHRRMRPRKRYKAERRPRSIGLCDFVDSAISGPPFASEICWKRASLGKVKHLSPFTHGLLEKIEPGMLPLQPGTVIIAFAIWWMVRFFAAPHCFKAEVFVPRVCMELSDSKRSIIEARHRSTQVGPATRFHLHGLVQCSIRLCITENARRRRLTSGADRITRSNANRACRVCVRETDSPSPQPIHVRSVDVRVPQRSDRVEPLLVGHDEQNVRPAHMSL